MNTVPESTKSKGAKWLHLDSICSLLLDGDEASFQLGGGSNVPLVCLGKNEFLYGLLHRHQLPFCVPVPLSCIVYPLRSTGMNMHNHLLASCELSLEPKNVQ